MMHFRKIDSDGYLQSGEVRLSDADWGRDVLATMNFSEHGALIAREGEHEVIIEAFDEPLVALQVEKVNDEKWRLHMPYQHSELTTLSAQQLSLDEWDRFHGITDRGLPFVLSRTAQATLLNQLEDYDDTGIFIAGHRHEIPAWPRSPATAEKNFWQDCYGCATTPWDLHGAHPALRDVLPQLKLNKARVLVLGAGRCHDAAHFAEKGHLVTAVELVPEAVAEAQKLYGHLSGLKIVCGDAFAFVERQRGKFDLVFEHTFYCALDPTRRAELAKTWRQAVVETGQLLGIFFVNSKIGGPPYGGSEWEVRERLKKHWRSLYWTRWRLSPGHRQGKELVVFAERLGGY